jgi:hypothetical protein
MADVEQRPGLLVVSPDVGLDTIGGERIRKLTAAFDDEGWRLIGLTPPARNYLSSFAPWPDSLVIHRTFDLNPWSLAVFLKRAARGGSKAMTPTPHGGEAHESGPLKASSIETFGTAALRRLWPYPWAGWVPFAVARGVSVARRERPVALLSSFSPTASPIAALALHRLTGLPWIADFRDPWTWGGDHGYVWARERRITVRAEAVVLGQATALTTIGPSLGAELASRASRDVVVLPHGIPVEKPDNVARASPFDRLELVHAGTVDSWSADVTPVVNAILRLAETETPARLTLVGPVEHRSPDLERAVRIGLVRMTGKVSRQEAQRLTAAADVAVLVQKRPSKIWVTTKLWDYLASRTPILVAADPQCDAAAIVRETRTGWTVPYDEDAIVATLAAAYEKRRRGERLWDPDEEALARYDAKAISRRFIELLNASR